LRPLLNPAHVANLARSAIVSVRSVSSKEVAAYGVLGAEILGFFTVGEIIGRRKLVGYRGNAPAQH
jgi:F-type H+-transporting ATPase subunit g